MKYSLNINHIDSNIFYTEYLLKKLIKDNNHELVSNIKADFILVSICDITELIYLKNIREQYKRKKIIVGGHVAIFFKACAIFADYVNVGQGFELFGCQSEEDIKKLDCIYYSGKDSTIKPSTYINWLKCPVVQLSVKRYSYWASIGCKNKCSFCLTSWTNKQQFNSDIRVKKAYEAIESKKGYSLKLIANEGYYNSNKRENVKDMLLIDFIKSSKINTGQVRIGVEFATEESRKKNGKYFTDIQFLQAIQRAREENIVLQCFCIGGIDSRQDWINLIDSIPDYYKLSPKIIFKFTNLEYQMFTPIHKNRYELDISKYLDGKFGKTLFDTFRDRQKNFKTIPIKYPSHALYRMGLSHCTNMKEFELMYKMRTCKDIAKMYNVVYGSGIIDNDYSDEIQFWYNKEQV